MTFKILAINPGSTSTKLAIYEDELEKYCETIDHSNEELAAFANVTDQLEFRKELVVARLKENGFQLAEISAVVGRGGMLPPVNAGGYLVSESMKKKADRWVASPACL